MVNDRVHAALTRIEAAIDRIDTRSVRIAAVPVDGELAARHERLREQTAAALARLDRLLGSGEQG